MDRRRFLSLGAATSLSVAVPVAWGWSSASIEPETLAKPSLLSVLKDPAHIRELGRRYRTARPDENGRDKLIEVLQRDLDPDAPPFVSDRLEARVRSDFAEGRTIQLDGWVLSVTEARQCALFSLLHVSPSLRPHS